MGFLKNLREKVKGAGKRYGEYQERRRESAGLARERRVKDSEGKLKELRVQAKIERERASIRKYKKSNVPQNVFVGGFGGGGGGNILDMNPNVLPGVNPNALPGMGFTSTKKRKTKRKRR